MPLLTFFNLLFAKVVNEYVIADLAIEGMLWELTIGIPNLKFKDLPNYFSLIYLFASCRMLRQYLFPRLRLNLAFAFFSR